MSRTVVCYIERAGGGHLIARVRLIAEGGAAGVDRSWTAPSLPTASAAPSPDAPEAAGGAGGEVISHTRTAARWVADSLSSLGTRRLAMLCVDPDGSVCTWLSAPSADPAIIQATLMQPDADGDGGGGGAARLLALGAGGGGTTGFSPDEASVQALATLEQPTGGGGSKLLSRRSANVDAAAQRRRFAVLAVPDACVRVFLDELDSRGIEVDQVVSFWHAMAMAWDPGSPAAAEESAPEASGGRVVSSVSPSAAIVAVDPAPGGSATGAAGGRLVWAWSQSGQLVAGGTMRLRAVFAARPPQPAPSDELAGPDAAKRVNPQTAGEPPSLEFTQADAGRLVLDWLSWSAQLGHCPQRVAVIGPAPVAGADGHATPDPGLIGRCLGEQWPGATVGVAVHDDPIGATLQRLLTIDIAQAHRRAAELEVAAGSDDPRASMVGLSSRAGRVDRRMHTWIAVGIAGVAVLVGSVGFKLHRSATTANADVDRAAEARKAAIDSMKESMPQIVASTNPKAELEAEATRLQNQNNSIKPPRPLLHEMAALITIIAEQSEIARDAHDADIKIERFDLNPVTGVVNLSVPDAESGPAIQEKLSKTPNLYMKWTGSTPGNIGLGPGERRYNLTGVPYGDNRPAGGGN